ncbi:MAG: hypothetical protein KGI50_03405 [Patescibacteria group bacterium]|nr:hypothetical protein [Patescibacteria group bacterium]MDE2438338.1 hypothetical protein [Patescibacteria group bacterium]
MTNDFHRGLLIFVETFVRHPDTDAVNVVLRRDRFALEVIIKAHPDDESMFTREVLDALKVLIIASTGIEDTVVYLKEHEPPEVTEREARSYM